MLNYQRVEECIASTFHWVLATPAAEKSQRLSWIHAETIWAKFLLQTIRIHAFCIQARTSDVLQQEESAHTRSTSKNRVHWP